MLLLSATYCCDAQLPAFPGAEGFGALATGGRGKEVYKVTNLNDAGAGSFRDAVSKPGRTVVFDVAGVIRIDKAVEVESDITIAGQTAPENSVVIYGNSVSFSRSHNIIVRYLTLRGSINMPRGKCVLNVDSAQNIIFDHVSVQWGRWDNVHIKGSTELTLQHCLIGESIDPQRFGALLEGPKNISIAHSLWISNQSRNPKAKADIEYINNIVYNWGSSGFVGGHSAADHHQDIINNYFIAGPSSKDSNYLSLFTKTDHSFQSGNKVDIAKDGKLNGIAITATDFEKEGATLEQQKQFHPTIPVTVLTTDNIFKPIVKNVGNAKYRDAIDTRLVENLKSLGTSGAIIHTENEVGGQKNISTGKPLADTDADGMPDVWERKMGLNINDPKDAQKINPQNNYTWLETYINALSN